MIFICSYKILQKQEVWTWILHFERYWVAFFPHFTHLCCFGHSFGEWKISSYQFFSLNLFHLGLLLSKVVLFRENIVGVCLVLFFRNVDVYKIFAKLKKIKQIILLKSGRSEESHAFWTATCGRNMKKASTTFLSNSYYTITYAFIHPVNAFHVIIVYFHNFRSV